MQWNDLQEFDENDQEQVHALREYCWESGRAAYTMQPLYGWDDLAVSEGAKAAHAFAVNMLASDKRWPSREQLLTGSPFGHTWVERMSRWWCEGYDQAREHS